MLILKIIFSTLCCVTYAESKRKPREERTLIDVILEENFGFQKTPAPGEPLTLDMVLNELFLSSLTIDHSKETGKKCFSCSPVYKAHYVITPTFDLVKAWVGCADVILDVPKFKRDKCRTSWAGVMLSIIKDRICMLAGGPVKVKLTTQDIINCCPNCKYKGQDLCEHGGDPLAAWKFWIKFGVDLGGTPLKKANPVCVNETKDVDKCKHLKCLIDVEGNVNKPKPIDLEIGQTAFILPNNMSFIQAEIMQHGSVQCSIQVFRDLLSYKSGVYKHKEGKFDGFHYVKLIGWDTDNATGTPFWKVVNPVWGPQHGDNGVIQFMRGENHCEIESNCIGSVYKKLGKTTDDKKKDEDKKKTKSSANLSTANFSLFFILLITHILGGDMSYC